MLYLDFDQDGQKELMTFAPFHGDTLAIYKLVDGSYQKVWEDERKMPFLHAIYPLEMNGKGIWYLWIIVRMNLEFKSFYLTMRIR